MDEPEINEDDVVAILRSNVEATINSLLDEKKLRWISNTEEFVEGLLVGLELAGIYGDEIHKLYNTND